MDEKGFVEGVRRYMSQLREEKRYSSAKSYQDALNSFIKYSGTENISYSDINKANLHRYEAYLPGERLHVQHGFHLYASYPLRL